jgi:hypothetical protein
MARQFAHGREHALVRHAARLNLVAHHALPEPYRVNHRLSWEYGVP